MREKQIKIDGLNINYKIIGNGNMPIILLHGWGVDSDKYIETLKQLSVQSSEFSVYAPDLPGFGKSDNPPEAWGVSEYTELIKKFMNELGLKDLILIGHSFGGRIAIKFAAKYPQGLKALVLTGAAGIKHSLTLKQKIFYILAKIGKAVFSLPIINMLQKPAQKLLYKAAQEKDYYQAQGIMRETFKKVINEDLTPYLEKISASSGSPPRLGEAGALSGKIPTLLIWGAKDNSTPLSDGRLIDLKIKSAGGRSELKIIDEANHSLPYQIPEKFAKIIAEFIKKDE